MNAFDILATKGIMPVAGAAITPEHGMWSMTPDGWSQHGTGKLEPYDKHKTPVAEQLAPHPMTLVSVRFSKAVIFGLLPVCAVVWAVCK
jgi:hypothetical protein